MSIANEITRLNTAKSNLRTAIQNKGVDVPLSATIDTYYTYVNQIVTGSGACTCDKVTMTFSGGSVSSTTCDQYTAGTLTLYDTSISLADREKIVSAVIGYCVTVIDGAFDNCRIMTSVTLPSTIVTIGDNSFKGCQYLPYIDLQVCTSLTSIGKSAFDECHNLTGITLPNSLTSIGSAAFYYARSLDTITIPSAVASIDNSAFLGCYALTSITCLATTPPTLGENVFYNTNDCPIYVPSASVNTYKAASGWSDYASRIQAIP